MMRLQRAMDTLLVLVGLLVLWQALNWYAGDVAITGPLTTTERALDLLARPRRATQELEARGDARFVVETANVDPPPQPRPAEAGDQVGHDALEGEAVERILGLCCGHRVFSRPD